MYVLGCKIVIGNNVFRSVSSVEIERSMHTLSDKCEIELPMTAVKKRNGEFVTNVPTPKAFNVGDEIEVQLGYNGNLVTEFRGFVKSIAPSTPTKIVCEDETYLLRKNTINKHYENATLKQIVEDCIKGTGITVENELPNFSLHQFTIRNSNAAFVLQKLIEDYGLTIFFPSWKKIHVGITVGGVVQKTTKYEIGRNVIDNDLEVVDSTDTELQLECKTILPNGNELKVTVGDNGEYTDKTDKKRESKENVKVIGSPEKRTMYFYNVQTAKELASVGLAHLQKLKYTGLKGSLTGFLIPFTTCGQSVSIVDKRFENRLDGVYLAEKVTVSFGEGGGRRRVELGLKLS